jgi:hypothetical protein
MTRRLPLLGWTLALAGLALVASGCVDRRFVIDVDPPPAAGANVYLNGRLIGPAPLSQSFTYYGTYRFVFAADGYETMVLDQCVSTPWWSYFPLEFVVENLLPFTIRDIRNIHVELKPMQVIPPEEILQHADPLRARGQAAGIPLPPTTPMPGPLPPPRAVPPPYGPSSPQ